MLLRELFRPERIVANLKASNKKDLFRELSGILADKCGVSDVDSIVNVIESRESKISTGIQTGIAIPHGKTNAVKGVAGIIGISRKGIDYNALDGKPVFLVFFIVSSDNSAEEHLAVLKRLATLLENGQFYQDILKMQTAKDIYKTLKDYEELMLK